MDRNGRNNKEPELEMFTLLNPEFYGVTESQFSDKKDVQVEESDHEKSKF